MTPSPNQELIDEFELNVLRNADTFVSKDYSLSPKGVDRYVTSEEARRIVLEGGARQLVYAHRAPTNGGTARGVLVTKRMLEML